MAEEPTKVEEKVDETAEAKTETNGHTNGDAEKSTDEHKVEINGSVKTDGVLPEPKTEAEAKENGAEPESCDVEKEAPKRKANEGGDAPLEPIPVSAEKVAKLQEGAEEKVEEKPEATA